MAAAKAAFREKNMSLLRFIRRDREERKPPVAQPVAPPPARPAPAAAAAPKPEAPIITPSPVQTAEAPALDLARIRQELEEIARIIGNDDGMGAAAADQSTVDLKLAQVISLAPQAFKDADSLRNAADTVLSIPVPNLYEQLTKGKVTTKLSLLLGDIPSDYLTDYVVEHGNDLLSLPLSAVVASVQPSELRKRTSAQERDLNLGALPNLFNPASLAASAADAPAEAPPAPPTAVAAGERPAPEPAVSQPEPIAVTPEPEPMVTQSEPEAAPEVAPAAAAESVAASSDLAVELPAQETLSHPIEEIVVEAVTEQPALQPAVLPEAAAHGAPVEVSVSADEDEKRDFRVLLGGLDINTASAREITQRVDGVGYKLACKIVESRETQGPFADLYDLGRVPGLRAKRFETLTGLKWDASHFKYRDLLKQIVGATDGALPDVRRVTQRFSEVPGFVGSMVIHEDGEVLSASWDNSASDALGAFAPQMFKKVNKYVKPLKLGEMNSLCFFVGHQPITVIRSGPIYFAALHRPDSLSKKQVAIAQALATELGRRFTARA